MNPRFAGVLFLAALQLTAQTQPGGQQLRERLGEVRETLSLTREQTEKVIPIILEEFKDLKAIRDGDGRPGQKLREANRIQRASDKELKEVLNEDQMKALKKLREQWRKERRAQGTAGPPTR